MPGEGQHAGMADSQKLKGWVNIQEYILQTLPNGWVNMQELAAKPQKTIGLGVGQHAGIVGQHEQEWWVNMGRNLHFGCGWVKLNVLQKLWYVFQLAALLILRSVGILSPIFSTVV